MRTKIIAVRLKSLLLIAAVAAVGLIIVLMILGMGGGEYKSGSYSSYIVLHGSPVEVSVEVDRENIKSIELKGVKEEQAVMYPTIESGFDELSKAVIEAQSTQVELDKDYEVAQGIIISAIDNALEQAKRE